MKFTWCFQYCIRELSAWGPHFFFRRITSANAFGGVIDQEGPLGPGLCFRQSQWSAKSEQKTGIVMVHEAAEATVYPFCGSDFPRPESSVGHHSNKFPFSFPNVDTVFSLATGPLKLKFRIPNQRRYRIGFLEFPLKVKWKIKEPNRGFNEQNRSSESHGQGAKWFLISNEAKHHKFKDDRKKCIFIYKCRKLKKSQGISEIYVFLNSISVKN